MKFIRILRPVSFCLIQIKMMADKLIVQAPNIVDREVVKPDLCGPGPCDVWPSVNEAYSLPVLSPLCDEYFNVVDDIRVGMQYLFQTRSKLVLVLSASGNGGMEAVITNLVAPKETLLVAARGVWDERAIGIAERYGINTVITRVPMNASFSLEQLEIELKKHRPTALFITHGDSSTGTVQNLEGLGKLCHKYGTLLLVDTVVSLVAVPFLMDEWEVDGVYTSTQKAFSGPAGLAPVAFSAKAEKKINERKHLPPFYFDIKLLAQQWNCYGNTRFYHHTMSPPLLWAIRACIKEACKETLPVSWARHAAVTAHFHKRLQSHKFKFFVPKPEDRLATVTLVVLPKGYDYMEVVKYIRSKYNILIFGGLGPTAGKALRIGIMGINSRIELVNAVVDALVDAMVVLRKSSI